MNEYTELTSGTPTDAALESMQLFLKSGKVTLEYLQKNGATAELFSTDEPLKPIKVRLTTASGRPVQTAAELAQKDCPYPHDPDL